MTFDTDSGELARVRTPILLVSATAWGLLLLLPLGPGSGHPHHAHASATVTGWALMLVAMMAPVLVPSIYHLRLRSFAHRRVRTIGLFVAAYAAIWMACGAVLIFVAGVVPAIVGLIVAVVWQCSPLKQRCLNRCHAHNGLAAFGIAADLAALRFGVTHAAWCVGSCWALMLFPLLLAQGHLVAMVVVALVIVSERLEQPRAPRWQVRGAGKLLRIVIAQARLRMRGWQLQSE